MLRIRLPEPILRTIDILAGASVPVALFAIGGSLIGIKIRGMIQDVSEVVAGKLILHPLAVGLMLWLLPPMDPAFRVAAIGYSSMPMLSIYPIPAQKYQLQGFCAASLLVASWLSFLTMGLIFWLIRNIFHWGI